MNDACEVKGVAFHTFLQALTELRGKAAVEQTQAALPAELRDGLRLGRIQRVGYYPLAQYSSLHTAAQQALRGGAALARDIGRNATDIDTRGLLRFVLGLTSTELLMRHAGKVWSSFARGSRVTVQQIEPRHHLVGFEGLDGATELVFVELEGAIERLIELTGARHSQVRRRVGKNGSSVGYSVTWQ